MKTFVARAAGAAAPRAAMPASDSAAPAVLDELGQLAVAKSELDRAFAASKGIRFKPGHGFFLNSSELAERHKRGSLAAAEAVQGHLAIAKKALDPGNDLRGSIFVAQESARKAQTTAPIDGDTASELKSAVLAKVAAARDEATARLQAHEHADIAKRAIEQYARVREEIAPVADGSVVALQREHAADRAVNRIVRDGVLDHT